MEWEHEGLPPPGVDFDAWLTNGQVRQVRNTDGCLTFLDCTHPAQNAYCDRSRVMAWRLAAPSPAQ